MNFFPLLFTPLNPLVLLDESFLFFALDPACLLPLLWSSSSSSSSSSSFILSTSFFLSFKGTLGFFPFPFPFPFSFLIPFPFFLLLLVEIETFSAAFAALTALTSQDDEEEEEDEEDEEDEEEWKWKEEEEDSDAAAQAPCVEAWRRQRGAEAVPLAPDLVRRRRHSRRGVVRRRERGGVRPSRHA